MVNWAFIGSVILFALTATVVFVVLRVTGTRRREASTARGGMAISILPRSSLGWWSVGLAVVFLLALIGALVLLGDDLLDPESNQSASLVLRIVFIALSAVSFVAGLASIIKRKESSVLVIVGMVITFWLGLITMVAHFFME